MLFLFQLLFIGEKTEEVSEAFITQWAVVLVLLELINSFHSPVIIVPECFSFKDSLTLLCHLKYRLILILFFNLYLKTGIFVFFVFVLKVLLALCICHFFFHYVSVL